MEKSHEATLLLYGSAGSKSIGDFVQGDTDVYAININLRDENGPFHIPDDAEVTIDFRHNARAQYTIHEKAEIVDKEAGTVLYRMIGSEYGIAGTFVAEVRVHSGTQTMTWPTFFYAVREAVGDVGAEPPQAVGPWYEGVNAAISGFGKTISSLQKQIADGGTGGAGYQIDADFFLPDTLYAVVGTPIEIYKQQVMRSLSSQTNYEVYIDHPTAGRNYARKWTFTPAAEHVPSVKFTAYVRDQANELIETKEITVMVSAPRADTPKKTLMMIGDSISTPGSSSHLYNGIRNYAKTFCGASTDVIEMVGTQGTAPNQHEATAGAKIEDFMSNTAMNGFWDTATGRTNFSAYTKRTGIKPDIVHLMLGTNNAWAMAYDDTAKVTASTDKLVQFVRHMRQDWPETLIIVGLIPFMGDQDIAEYYRTPTFRLRQAQYDKVVQMYASALYHRLGTDFPGDGNIIPCPYTVIMDRDFGYGEQTAPANPFTTETVKIPVDFLHPQEAGQKQMASSVVSIWAKYVQESQPGYVITNMLTNPDLTSTANWNNMQSTLYDLSAASGVVKLTGKDGESGTGGTVLQNARPYIEGHKMYVRGKAKANDAALVNLYSQGLQVGSAAVVFTTQKVTEWITLSEVVTVTAAHVASPYFAFTSTITTARDLTGTVFERTEPLCVDLTAAFGEGNEPAKEWCDNNIPFFVGSMELEL